MGVCWLYVRVYVSAAFFASVLSTDFVGLEPQDPKILISTKLTQILHPLVCNH